MIYLLSEISVHYQVDSILPVLLFELYYFKILINHFVKYISTTCKFTQALSLTVRYTTLLSYQANRSYHQQPFTLTLPCYTLSRAL